jgi:hypothetical protein
MTDHELRRALIRRAGQLQKAQSLAYREGVSVQKALTMLERGDPLGDVEQYIRDSFIHLPDPHVDVVRDL